MSVRARNFLLLLAALAILPSFWRVAADLPAFGTAVPSYGESVNRLAPELRHLSNMVSAVNFDIRGFDTVGEKFMLLCAVAGTVLPLRGGRGADLAARAGRLPGRALEQQSDATVLASRVFGTVTLVFGIYMALHATATPGGGFQGGVIVASGLLMLYLGEGYARWRVLLRSPLLDAAEGGGALLFVAAGLLPVGICGVVSSRSYVHLIGCITVIQSSTYVLLLGIGYRWGAGPPVFYDHPPGTSAVDPIVQALALTDVVVNATVSALLLDLALQVHTRHGTLHPQAIELLDVKKR